jgi:polysaccharide biosynthesis/export protein
MASGRSSAVLRDVQTLFVTGTTGGASDGQLLERFCSGNEDAETAFAALVARHGSMVLGVCRRTLRNPDDVADAFQATFLVLVRKAGSIRVDDSLGRWLYGVSRRVAARARVESARRAKREPSRDADAIAPDDTARRELLEALDEEVARLSAPFRAAVVLCDLDGLTHEAAAKQLGCPVGTIESRLSRGRQRLRERLVRRGFASSVAVPGLLDGLVSPVVPEALSTLTTRSALTRWASSATAGAILQGVLRDMAWIKIKVLTVGLVAVALLGGVGLVALSKSTEHDKPKPPSTVKATTTPEAIALQPMGRVKPGDVIRIEVLQALPGRPLSGPRIVRPDGTVSLNFYGDLKVGGLTRDEIKVKVIEHMLRFLPDEILGLEMIDPENGKIFKIKPIESDRVFVDDTPGYAPEDAAAPFQEKMLHELDSILNALHGISAAIEGRANKDEDPEMPPTPGPAGPTREPSPAGDGGTRPRIGPLTPDFSAHNPFDPQDREGQFKTLEEIIKQQASMLERLRNRRNSLKKDLEREAAESKDLNKTFTERLEEFQKSSKDSSTQPGKK